MVSRGHLFSFKEKSKVNQKEGIVPFIDMFNHNSTKS